MGFKCADCNKVVYKVGDIRNCSRCQAAKRAFDIPASHLDNDWLTPVIVGCIVDTPSTIGTPTFVESGGQFGGAGAGGVWDSILDPSASDSDPSSGSSANGGSSNDSGSSSGGESD